VLGTSEGQEVGPPLIGPITACPCRPASGVTWPVLTCHDGGLCYIGLPRGRVTRPGRDYFLLHGEDAPVEGWEGLVVERFRLLRGRVRPIFEEHESSIPGHPRAFHAIFDIGRTGAGADHRGPPRAGHGTPSGQTGRPRGASTPAGSGQRGRELTPPERAKTASDATMSFQKS